MTSRFRGFVLMCRLIMGSHRRGRQESYGGYESLAKDDWTVKTFTGRGTVSWVRAGCGPKLGGRACALQFAVRQVALTEWSRFHARKRHHACSDRGVHASHGSELSDYLEEK